MVTTKIIPIQRIPLSVQAPTALKILLSQILIQIQI